MSRGRRGLSEEEKRLWETVARSARPIRQGMPTTESRAPEAPAGAPQPAVSAPGKPGQPARRGAKAVPAPLAVIDRRTRTQIARGTLDIDARLDLHGLTQSRAHQRLRRFLEAAQADGAKLVLIITGKGKPADEVSDGGELGVLKRAVPSWLAGTEFRDLVQSFDEAGRRHGGGGALYVRLRRRRRQGGG
jgi:DNA-nicking Smr family endonuclease